MISLCIYNKEAINILGNIIIIDIRNLKFKNLDKYSIEEDKIDLTFFNIDEEETNETLKLLKQSYVTSNYKEETILNLQNSLKNSSTEDMSKELKLESYKKYNHALELANKNYITNALELIKEAVEINPKDTDILNLRGLLSLLKCDFSVAFESFYTSMCYKKDETSTKYIDILSSEEFKVFLGRYNHAIRFINEELNQESIHILNNIIEEDNQLIEPYVILALLYDKLDNQRKKDYYLDKLKEIDKGNELLEIKLEESNDVQEETKNVKNNKKNVILYTVLGGLVIGLGVYSFNNKNKLENLNSELSKKEQELSQADEKIKEKEEIIKENDEKIKQTNEELNKTNEQLEAEKNKEPQMIVADEASLYNNGVKLKKVNNYKGAIDYFKKTAEYGKTKKYISASIYETAYLSEKIGNDDDAITYYKKYLNTYSKEDEYYDESFYNLGMLYYKNGDLQKAKNTFYGLRSEVPDSMYNNSKVKEILSK